MKKIVVDELANRGATRAEAERMFDAVFDAVAVSIKSNREVRIPQLGTFKVKRRDERQARNPRTGESVRVAARDALTFKQSKSFSL